MNLDIYFRIQFRTEQVLEDRGPQVIEKPVDLCFRHAVFAVMHHKKKINVVVQECGEYETNYTECVECDKEDLLERTHDDDDDDYDPSMDDGDGEPPDKDPPSLAKFFSHLNKKGK